jgi:hypothetical protein
MLVPKIKDAVRELQLYNVLVKVNQASYAASVDQVYKPNTRTFR